MVNKHDGRGPVRYHHVRTGCGSVTFAIVERDDLAGVGVARYEVAVALCAPRDQFNRARGRRIAEGRLRSAHPCSLRILVEVATGGGLPPKVGHVLKAALAAVPVQHQPQWWVEFLAEAYVCWLERQCLRAAAAEREAR